MAAKLFRLLVFGIAIAASGCQTPAQREAERQRVERDRDSAAFKAGQKARQVTREAGKAAAAAGRQIENGARRAREGWKDQERQEREQKRR